MQFNEIKERDLLITGLKKRLQLRLPGTDAQLKMASKFRSKEIYLNPDTAKANKSSVLILLYPKSGNFHTLFIQRQNYNGVHSGQISFPGGRMENGDVSLIHTALREANEEVNIQPEKVEILGSLSELYIPPSNFLVLPVIGYSSHRHDFQPDPSEVAEIIEADIAFLFDDQLKKRKIIDTNGFKIEAPYFDVHGKVIWGATAMILSELEEVILSIR